MASKKQLICVAGITGRQGGAVADWLLKSSNQFEIRGLAKSFTAEERSALKAKGIVDLLEVDFLKPESLANAYKGCYGAFVMTQYWGKEARSAEKDKEEGENQLNAAYENDVKCIVLSGQESPADLTSGKVSVEFFDGKYALEKVLKGMRFKYWSIVRWSSYFDHMLGVFKPTKVADDKWEIQLPLGEVVFPMMNAEDGGAVAAACFADPEGNNKKTFNMAREVRNMTFYAETMAGVAGKAISYRSISMEDYIKACEKRMGDKAKEIISMVQYHACGIVVSRPNDLLKFNPSAVSFEEWLVNNRDKLNAVLAK